MVNSLSLAVTRTTPVLPADTQIVKAYAANPFTFNVSLTGSETFTGITSVRMQIREYPFPAANAAALADITNVSPSGTTSAFAFTAAQFNQTTVHPSKTYWIILTALDPDRGMLVLWRARLLLHPHYASETTADPPEVTTKLTLEEANAIYATITNLALKANIASPTFTGTPAAPTAAPGTNTTQISTTAFVTAAVAAGGAGVADGDYIDITVSASGATWTIDNGTVTNAKAADMATATIKGRATAGTGDPEDLSVSQTKTLLALNNVDNTSDANKPISSATQSALDLKLEPSTETAAQIFSFDLTLAGGPTQMGSGANILGGELSLDNASALHIDTLASVLFDNTSFTYGTGAAAAHRTALGLGTLATQSGTFSGSGTLATGGFTLTVPATGTAALAGTYSNSALNATTIGATTPGTGAFTTLTASSTLAVTGASTMAAITSAQLALVTTPTDGVLITNTTDASAGTPVQYSPALSLSGTGWATGTSSSMAVKFRQYVVPAQGTSAPTGKLTWDSSVGGAAAVTRMTLDTLGDLIVTSSKASTILVGVTGTHFVMGLYGSSSSANSASNRFTLAANTPLGWSNTNNTVSVSTNIDTSIIRSSAGVVEINNGTVGTLRDLSLRNLTASGTLAIGGGTAIQKVLSATATLDFDLTAVTVHDLTITVTGAALGDVVSVGVPNGSVTATASYTAWVSAADTVTVRCKTAVVGENPASGTFRVMVTKF